MTGLELFAIKKKTVVINSLTNIINSATSYLEVEDLFALADRAIHGCPLPLAEGALQLAAPPAGLVELSHLTVPPLKLLFVHLLRFEKKIKKKAGNKKE